MSVYQSFIFSSYSFDPASRCLSLRYSFEDGPGFEEKIVFPEGVRVLSTDEEAALDRAFRLIFLLAGVSYYKAAIPPRLVCKAFSLDRVLAQFCERTYRGGLGEFAYRNQVELDFAFQVDTEQPAPPVPLDLPNRALVPVGGGKDSIVSIETLKRAERPISLFALGGAGALAEPIAGSIRVSGLEAVHVRRTIALELIELNKQGALNGHVPITAILSAIAVACAMMYGYDAVVLSNEGSASAPNVVWKGQEINHQFSKSYAFEKDFQDIVRRTISPSLRYFSFLRPLSETAIAARFAWEGSAYFNVFRSCNTAFRQDETKRGKHWCCDCPKCRFVFLALAPFMAKDRLVAIFGRNMLDDPAQTKGFEELCGLSDIKPFECVGEIEESARLMLALGQRPEWAQDAIVADFAKRLKQSGQSLANLLGPTFDHQVPAGYFALLARKIVVWGAGREGIAAARLLKQTHPDAALCIIDENEKATLPPDLVDVDLIVAPDEFDGALADADLLVKSPGVSLYHPLLKKHALPVTSLLNLWLAQSRKAQTIMVTGTKGKSTTASLLAHVLNALGKKAVLVGNIGVPVTEANLTDADYCVVEVSSYQAANLNEKGDYGLLVSLYPEHLNWHGSVAQYYLDKCHMLELCRTKLCAQQAAQVMREQDITIDGVQVVCVDQPIEGLTNPYLLRAHNLPNVSVVLALIEKLGLSKDAAIEAMNDFQGLPHRQQEIGQVDGVLYVDDSISTTPQSAIAALEVYQGMPITLIAGGQDRGVNLAPLTDYIASHTNIWVVCMGECAPRLMSALPIDRAVRAADMPQAVSLAKAQTPAGGVILLSPAAPSYDMFKDFTDRARAFAEAAGIEL